MTLIAILSRQDSRDRYKSRQVPASLDTGRYLNYLAKVSFHLDQH